MILAQNAKDSSKVIAFSLAPPIRMRNRFSSAGLSFTRNPWEYCIGLNTTSLMATV
jgi:hypothetical protein